MTPEAFFLQGPSLIWLLVFYIATSCRFRYLVSRYRARCLVDHLFDRLLGHFLGCCPYFRCHDFGHSDDLDPNALVLFGEHLLADVLRRASEPLLCALRRVAAGLLGAVALLVVARRQFVDHLLDAIRRRYTAIEYCTNRYLDFSIRNHNSRTGSISDRVAKQPVVRICSRPDRSSLAQNNRRAFGYICRCSSGLLRIGMPNKEFLRHLRMPAYCRG